MPKLAVHLAAGATLFCALALAMPQKFPPAIQTLAAMLLASAFPDIDHPKTKIFRATLAASAAAAAIFAYATLQNSLPQATLAIASLAAGILAVIAIRLLKPRHRGITHSLLAAAAFGGLCFIATSATAAQTAPAQTGIAATAAYTLHLLLDGEVKLA